MTALHPARPVLATGAAPLVPSSCRVSILVGDDHQVDMVLPAAVPLAALVDATRDAINRQLRSTGEDEMPRRSYVFVRAAGMTELAGDTSLAAQGVTDADLLALVPADRAVRYTPNIENVSTALARWAREHFPTVTPRDAAMVAVLLVLVALGACATILWRMRWAGADGWLVPAVFGAAAVVLIVVSWLCTRLRTETFVVGATGAAAGVAAMLAGASAPPGPHPGAPNGFLAALVAVVAAVALSRATGRYRVAAAAVTTVAAAGIGAGLVRMFFDVPGQRIAVVTLVVVLVASVMSSHLARAMAKVPRQSFRSITGDDLFARAPGQPEDTLSPVADAPDDVTLRGEQVGEMALRSNRVLRGVLTGIAAVQVTASWFAIHPGHGSQWPFVAVVTTCALISVLRARAFRDRRCSITLVVGATLSLFAIPTHVALAADATATATGLWCAAVVLALAAAALTAGVLVPKRMFSETFRELVEYLEYALYVLVVPFAAWAIGYLQYVRNH
ncbi:type VII secretion integral membrane protein EccD [Mycolicibacterium sp. P1-18]|uniref:type VII secretion integral membrane protein EccD n=1 Tax=Mycolicibacterium sp. P1-18 TaxID=2024615 RepID=UPI0011F2F50B|nr:type VII secretion integral membrane protein EccD [Mycolicibacterium sp. P1-18]KAA0093694.1 type VII secretion integral membrane protein EccD [Mycolicibacterium sp. P1-18]